MKKRKYLSALSFVLAIIMLLSLAACGQTAANESSNPTTAVSGEPELPKVTWRFAIQGSDGTTMGRLAYRLAEEVSTRTNGGFTITVFTGGVLGKNTELLESVQAGSLDMTQCVASGISNFVPELGFWGLPYLITNWDSAEALMASDLFDDYDDILLASGFYPLSLYFGGFRHALNNVRPITCLEDFFGIKFRVLENSMYIDTFNALGAYPTNVAASEVNTALQQHTIDGYENPLDNVLGDGAYEFLTYLSMTRHMVQTGYYVANPDSFNALPEVYQDVLLEVCSEMSDEFLKLAREGEDEWAQTMVDAGMIRNDLTDEALQEIVDTCRTVVWPNYEEKYGDIMEAITAFVG